jgi:hypothetical protein
MIPTHSKCRETDGPFAEKHAAKERSADSRAATAASNDWRLHNKSTIKRTIFNTNGSKDWIQKQTCENIAQERNKAEQQKTCARQ